MLTYPDKSIEVQKVSQEELTKSEEERRKKERLRDVFLLLQQLVEREEVTIKLIIDWQAFGKGTRKARLHYC